MVLRPPFHAYGEIVYCSKGKPLKSIIMNTDKISSQKNFVSVSVMTAVVYQFTRLRLLMISPVMQQ